ncbi:MAG: isopentenyl-diphosphate Delta-isomerase [Boseongicola sp.]
MTNLIPAWVDGELKAVEKMEVHFQGFRHKAVSVFLLDGKRVLLQKRAASKYHTPGLWSNTCCTHPNWDESPEDCALRRLDEELGITGVSLDFRHQAEYRADVGGGMTEHELVDIFVGSASPDLEIIANPAEVSDVDWCDLNDLTKETENDPSKFTPWLGIYLREHSQTIFASI